MANSFLGLSAGLCLRTINKKKRLVPSSGAGYHPSRVLNPEPLRELPSFSFLLRGSPGGRTLNLSHFTRALCQLS